MINLIGITGPARHGKDTVGRMIMKHMPATERFAFADKIKEFLEDSFMVSEGSLENKEEEQLFTTTVDALAISLLNNLHKAVGLYGPLPFIDLYLKVLQDSHEDYVEIGDEISFTSSWRKMYQITGTEWGRQGIHEEFWIAPYLPDSNAVITDVRGHGDSEEHLNIEAKAILDKGGVIVKVYDPRKGSVVRTHTSEAGISDEFITYTIENDGDLELLEDKVMNFIYSYLLEGEQ